jgi:hypothetical protein
MHEIGYSTGAIALGDFSHAINTLRSHQFRAIELSALRIQEVQPLIAAIPHLDLKKYAYISFHAPSAFSETEEEWLIALLKQLPDTWPIILHPDAIHNFERWRALAGRVAIENMDRRKSTGRSARELVEIFRLLPQAMMCLDIGHARQIDTSMLETYVLIKTFSDRIVQLHVSEVDSMNRHERISIAAQLAFRQLKNFIPDCVPVILEARVAEQDIEQEARNVARVLARQSGRNSIS